MNNGLLNLIADSIESPVQSCTQKGENVGNIMKGLLGAGELAAGVASGNILGAVAGGINMVSAFAKCAQSIMEKQEEKHQVHETEKAVNNEPTLSMSMRPTMGRS